MSAIGIHPPNIATDENGDPLSIPANVLLTFSAVLAAGQAVDIQTGAHAGGPAAVQGDAITLPPTGGEFVVQGAIVSWNGQALERGSMLGQGEVHWISQTQVAFAFNVQPGNQVSIQVV